jgi:DNA-binding transcriptional LysR family regulator
MDRLDAIAAFIAVCDAGGFTAASRRLRVSPSVVTRQVASLEQHLGARLLQRTTRSIGMTEAGQRFLERARTILSDLGEAERAVQDERAAPTGTLAVAAPVLFGRMHVAPMLARFMQKFPQVRAELQLSDRVVNLIEDGIDVGIRIGHLPDSQLIARRLGETRRVVVASPSYLRKHGRPKHPDELARHDTIAFMGLVATADWRFADDGKELSVRVTPRLVTNSGDAAVGYAIQGGGVALALSYQVREAIAGGELIEVLAPFSLPPLPIQAVYPSSRLISNKVRAFVDMLDKSADWRFSP